MRKCVTDEQKARRSANTKRSWMRLSPEERRERKRVYEQRYRDKNREAYNERRRKRDRSQYRKKHSDLNEAERERERERSRAYYAANKAKVLARQARLRAEQAALRPPKPPKPPKPVQPPRVGPPAYPLCAAPSPARDALVQVRAIVRGPETDDIVAEAMLMIVEGETDINKAVAAARKKVYRDIGKLAYAKPLEDCYWI